MSIINLSVKQLEHAVELLKQRAALQSQIEGIDHQLHEIENGKFIVADRKKRHERLTDPQKMKLRVHRRRNIRQAVLNALKIAGSEGLTVKELAFRAKVKTGSLRTWLYTAGKKIADIKKVAPGIFAMLP
jgi:predicted DNA-binding protein (UPF0251 family)